MNRIARNATVTLAATTGILLGAMAMPAGAVTSHGPYPSPVQCSAHRNTIKVTAGTKIGLCQQSKINKQWYFFTNP